MKHGDKKGKTAKAAGQASGKKDSGKKALPAGKETRKASETSQKQQAGAKETGAKAGAKSGGAKEAVPPPRPAAKAGSPARGGEDGFTNAVVAGAFKRAVKKYPNAFRKLTD